MAYQVNLIYLAPACMTKGYVIGVGLHIYMYICNICIYVFDSNKLNAILAVDSPFVTLSMDFSSIYRLALVRAPGTISSLSKLRILVLSTHLALFP